ncbi:MAG: nucleotidyltransferase [Minicystis sp.]
MSRSAPAELLAALAAAMRAHGFRWYVFGAQAVMAHGRPRLTADVDATVDLGAAGTSALLDALDMHGFALRFPLSDAHLREARLLPMVHLPSGMPLDLVIAAPGLDDEFLERARLVNLGGVEVPVVSAEDLVAMKLLAGRRKDLEDIRGVLSEQQDRLNLGRVRDVLAAFEAVTGEPTLIAKLERMLRARAGRGSRRGTPKARG